METVEWKQRDLTLSILAKTRTAFSWTCPVQQYRKVTVALVADMYSQPACPLLARHHPIWEKSWVQPGLWAITNCKLH